MTKADTAFRTNIDVVEYDARGQHGDEKHNIEVLEMEIRCADPTYRKGEDDEEEEEYTICT